MANLVVPESQCTWDKLAIRKKILNKVFTELMLHFNFKIDPLIPLLITSSIVPIQDELYLGGSSHEDSDAEVGDDEDSNEESNCRNDYPDEDEVKDDADEYK